MEPALHSKTWFLVIMIYNIHKAKVLETWFLALANILPNIPLGYSSYLAPNIPPRYPPPALWPAAASPPALPAANVFVLILSKIVGASNYMIIPWSINSSITKITPVILLIRLFLSMLCLNTVSKHSWIVSNTEARINSLSYLPSPRT